MCGEREEKLPAFHDEVHAMHWGVHPGSASRPCSLVLRGAWKWLSSKNTKHRIIQCKRERSELGGEIYVPRCCELLSVVHEMSRKVVLAEQGKRCVHACV
jgi:hypothetical protein